MNILYCLDENYNTQFFCSALSVLDKSTEKIDIYVIHNNAISLDLDKHILNSHPKLNNLNIIEFNVEGVHFPNIENAHVSEATYYRLYIESLLPESIDQILYLDCDVICVSEFINEANLQFKLLDESKNAISVNTEFTKDKNNTDFFSRFDSSLKTYFNAGVMFIDLNKWRQKFIQMKSLEIITNKNIDLVFWDQDVLNILFNGEYLELDNIFNFKVGGDNLNKTDVVVSDNEIFIHYMGSKKPWTLEGLIDKNSKYYQLNYMKINKKNYHIVINWKAYSLSFFLKNTLNLKLLKHTQYLNLTKSYIKSLR